MIPQTGTILCIDAEEARQAPRCAILSASGYTAVSATPHQASIILRDRVFDIVVTVGVSDSDLERVFGAMSCPQILALGESTPPTLLLFLVDERLRQLRAASSPTPHA